MTRLQTELIEKKEDVGHDKFYRMLECLPPVRLENNGFLVGEPMDHEGPRGQARYELYFYDDAGYFYGGLATKRDFDMMVIPNNKTTK